MLYGNGSYNDARNALPNVEITYQELRPGKSAYRLKLPKGHVRWMRNWKQMAERYGSTYGVRHLHALYWSANQIVWRELRDKGQLQVKVSLDTTAPPVVANGLQLDQRRRFRSHNTFVRFFDWKEGWELCHNDLQVVVNFEGLGSPDWASNLPNLLVNYDFNEVHAKVPLTLPYRMLKRLHQGDRLTLPLHGFPVTFTFAQPEGQPPFEQQLVKILAQHRIDPEQFLQRHPGYDVAMMYVRPEIPHIFRVTSSRLEATWLRELNSARKDHRLPEEYFFRPGDMAVHCFFGYDQRLSPQDEDPLLYEDWQYSFPLAEGFYYDGLLPLRILKDLREGDWLRMPFRQGEYWMKVSQLQGAYRELGRFEEALKTVMRMTL